MKYTIEVEPDGAESIFIKGRTLCSIVLDKDGTKWVPLKLLCTELGIQPDAQRRRIQSSPWATSGMIAIKASDQKVYRTFCLALDDLGMWLDTLSIGRLKGSPTKAYFIRSRLTGYIKIGTSVNARKRLRGLASMYPDCFELIAVGGIESELHKQLNTHRVHGEWFQPHADVLRALHQAGGSLDNPIMIAGLRGLKKKSDGSDDFSWIDGMKFEVDD
jgi:hypothetical protein